VEEEPVATLVVREAVDEVAVDADADLPELTALGRTETELELVVGRMPPVVGMVVGMPFVVGMPSVGAVAVVDVEEVSVAGGSCGLAETENAERSRVIETVKMVDFIMV